MTTAYPGPLATDTFDRQTIDNSKRPNNKSETLKPSQESERGGSSFWGDPKTYKTQPDATTHGLPHYPMDPGHPTASYNGPYSPDYTPTHPTVENVFHLSSTHPEKPMSTPKEKSKSKSENKKPVEPVKPHKDTIDQYFPGPLAPNRFPDKATRTSPSYSVNENQHVPGSPSPNKPPPRQKDVPINHHPPIPHSDTSSPHFPYVSNNNKGNLPPAGFNDQLDISAGAPHRGAPPIPVKPDTIDPNIIVPPVPKRKASPTSLLVDADKSKAPPILPSRPKQGQRNPDQEILPEQLYHLINLHHPGLTQLDQTTPQGHPGLYDLHQQISSQKQPPNDRGQVNYFGAPPSAPKKVTKPHILAQKNENGQTTYHIHTPEIPTSPQQLEELLAHISQHDPNPGPFQHYPGQPAIPHSVPNGSPTPPILPLHIDAHIPHSGLTHSNHPFAAQTPNQSGSFLITRRDNVRDFR